MALDVYVGGFARFYAREWENVVQAWARETGTHYQQIAPGGLAPPPKWDEVAEAVNHWRSAINQGLGANLSEPLDWDESRNAPYFTDRPGYEGYGALLVWAAHTEMGTPPPKDYSGEWYSDDAFKHCLQPTQGQRYRPITCGSVWLPGTFVFSFDFQDLTGEKSHICANASLENALNELNAATFKMSPDDLDAARKANYGENPTLADLARFGLACLHGLAVKSVEHHLPIQLST
jgi:hypothetical protein